MFISFYSQTKEEENRLKGIPKQPSNINDRHLPLTKSKHVLVVTTGGLKEERYWLRLQVLKKGKVIGQSEIPFNTQLKLGRGECYPVEGVVGHALDRPHQWICESLTKKVK